MLLTAGTSQVLLFIKYWLLNHKTAFKLWYMYIFYEYIRCRGRLHSCPVWTVEEWSGTGSSSKALQAVWCYLTTHLRPALRSKIRK